MTFWNKNEDFPSMGIGHFIWPPKSYTGTSPAGGFHKVLAFMKKQGISIPLWLENNRSCPYETREEFYKEFDSKKMKELRAFLVKSIPYQVEYIVYRLHIALEDIILSIPIDQREREFLRKFTS